MFTMKIKIPSRGAWTPDQQGVQEVEVTSMTIKRKDGYIWTVDPENFPIELHPEELEKQVFPSQSLVGAIGELPTKVTIEF